MTETVNRATDQLTEAARKALQLEPLLHGLPVFVTVENGAASLYGEVASRSEALAAERAVLGVPGVHAVAENLVLALPPLSDSDVAQAAAQALIRAPHVPETVRATVSHRHVTLTGEVNWQYEREAACRAVDELPGVDTVRNAITVRSGTMAVDLEKLILTTLANRDPLSEVRLTVTTNGRGAIMLDGSVPTVEARREAEAICWGVPGAAVVTNHLSVLADDGTASGLAVGRRGSPRRSGAHPRTSESPHIG
jgi:osmotically-inducible protein OsmY